LLQVFGTDVGRELFGETFWIDQAFKRAAEYQRVVFSDVRFPNEAKAIQNKGGDVWRINRHNHAPVNHHISEHAMDNHLFKHVIYNDGTLDDLSDEVFMLAKELGL
jgi:aspartyl/asparaginyl beta-hydroxylase (cupin superfamily)